MIDGIEIIELDCFEDERGCLSEIYRSDETDYIPSMAYISHTKPNKARGPHEHKFQTDYFIIVVGSFEVFLWDNRKGSTSYGEKTVLKVGGDKPTLIIVPPGIVHGYKCISENVGAVINLSDKLYKGEGKKEEVDEIRHEDDPTSEFKIK